MPPPMAVRLKHNVQMRQVRSAHSSGRVSQMAESTLPNGTAVRQVQPPSGADDGSLPFRPLPVVVCGNVDQLVRLPTWGFLLVFHSNHPVVVEL